MVDDDDTTLSEPVPSLLLRQGSVELSYREVPASEANLATPWRAIDICTKNTIYALDARLVCTAVIDRATGETKEDHVFVGASLVGGTLRTDAGKLRSIAHPLPEVGMSAVFQGVRAKRPWYNETSEVTRIIIRQRVVRFDQADREPSWEDITGSGRKNKKTLIGSPY